MSVIGVGPLAVDVCEQIVLMNGTRYPLGRRAVTVLVTLLAARGRWFRARSS